MLRSLYGALMILACISLASGDFYSHRYDTFEISFSTPGEGASVQWGDERPGMTIRMNLGGGERPYITPHTLTTWESRAETKANLAKLWTSCASGNAYTIPTITRTANGDFLVFGRMMIRSNKITRTMRTFDLDGNGRLDYIVFWSGDGKFDYGLLNQLATTTRVRLIAPENDAGNLSSQPREPLRRSGASTGRAFVGG